MQKETVLKEGRPMKNNIEFDCRLFDSFFQDVNLETGSHIYLPEHCGFNNQHHACFVMLNIYFDYLLRSHKIFLVTVIPKWATGKYSRLPSGMLYRYTDLQLI